MSRAKLRVVLRGSPRWLPLFEDQLPELGMSTLRYQPVIAALRRGNPGPGIRFIRSHILHQVFVHLQSASAIKLFTWSRRVGVPVVAHWIGTDVVHLREFVQTHAGSPPFLSRTIAAHLADSPALQQELSELGVESTVVRLLPRTLEASVLPLPQDPAILCYWPDDRAEFYRIDIVMELARRFGDMTFYIAAATGHNVTDPPKNVVFLGEVVDMESLYAKVTAFLRIVPHDSLSAMVLEALARGRYVLYSESFPHTFQVSNVDDAAAGLEKLRTLSSPNSAGAAYVSQNFSWRHEIETLKNIYTGLRG